ncbi:hypothetical protein, partial [Streptomyces kaniharaensis]|uniref:hypothetical protein n=1 Tax=Streptomyces kaniharaensis TaxID=212423 RepID=UPI001E2B5525
AHFPRALNFDRNCHRVFSRIRPWRILEMGREHFSRISPLFFGEIQFPSLAFFITRILVILRDFVNLEFLVRRFFWAFSWQFPHVLNPADGHSL